MANKSFLREPVTRVKRRRKHRCETAESRDRWLISYADLVTLLLALFIVLFASANRERATGIASGLMTELGIDQAGPAATSPQTNATKSPSERSPSTVDTSDAARNQIGSAQAVIERAFAASESLRRRASFTTTERGIVVTLTEAGFFAPGEANIKADALPLIDSLARSLRESNSPLRVEGHTDSAPISNSRFHSNWELSAARAATVLSRLIAHGIPSSNLSLAGYADERPVADNATVSGRAFNRRVDLVILADDDSTAARLSSPRPKGFVANADK